MKKKTRKYLLYSGVFFLLLLGGGLWYSVMLMQKPLYEVGDVRSGKNLRGPIQPPEQTDPSSWKVESDITLQFDTYGEGTPVVVVHGGPGIPYGDHWNGLRPLSEKYQFYYYHQRGCGESTRPFDRFEAKNFYSNMLKLEKTLGLGAQVADLERIRQILGQEKLIFIGHSFGGFLASLYAAEFPSHVERLILVAPAGVLTFPDQDRNIFENVRKTLPEEEVDAYDKLVEKYFDFGNIFSRSESELVELHEETGAYILPAMGYDYSEIPAGPKSGGWAVFAMYFSSGMSPNYAPALENITAPTLIIHGEDDSMSLAGSRSYQKAIPGAEFKIVTREDPEIRAGHFVYNDAPESFQKLVEDFLEGGK